jgi:predicted lipoprotein with Yx(FWY)xxD motif
VCNAECATAWPPFAAPADAKAEGNWSVVTRDDGAKQWALNGKPLYTFAKDERPGDGKGHNAAKVWHIAAFAPAAKMQTPPGITAKETVAFDGQALVNGSGMTLYMSDADKPNMSSCVAACLKTWTPLEAPRVAAPIGEFASIGRADGGRQWAFNGKPLYTFAGDVKAGDANGANVDPQWHEVMLVRYYRPSEVNVTIHPKHGAMLTTANGMTLYARDAHRFTLAGGAHDDRSAMRGTPATGRRIGIKGCTDECLQEWVPYKAPANAVTTGFWSVVDRPDGTKQWAYNGYPLYTFTGDKAPGAALGHDMYQMTDGTTGLFWRVALP